MKKTKQLVKRIVSVLMLLVLAIPASTFFAEGAFATEAEIRSRTEGVKTAIDFTSKRLLVQTDNAEILPETDVVLASYDNTYLLQYETEQAAEEAYAYFQKKADAVEADTLMTIAEDAEPASMDEVVMTEEENPFAELREAIEESEGRAFDIALIDTGLDDAAEAVSVIGEETGDDHGHGTLVAKRMREQNPNAKILSVKALDEKGHGTISSVYAAFAYAKSQNVKIINLSMSAWATEDSAILETSVREAAAEGIQVVGAAGNNGRDAAWFVPGYIEEAWIIGAADAEGSRLAISNYGPSVDYYAGAASTSEAAGTMSGYLSAHNLKVNTEDVNRSLIFTPTYVEAHSTKPEETPAYIDGTAPEEAEEGLRAAADKFNKNSITTKEWSDIRPGVDYWLNQNIPYVSPCSNLINWTKKTASGLDCSGFVNAIVHLYYEDGNVSYDWQGSWFASATWPVGLEEAGLKIIKDTTKKAFNDAYDKGKIRPGDIVVFSNKNYRGVHVAIVYGENKNGEVVLAHAYGSKVQKTTFNNVYDWDFASAGSSFDAAGSGTYTYYEIFRGTPVEPEEAGIKVVKKISETNPKLTVKKELAGNGAEKDRAFDFSITYTPTDNSEKQKTTAFKLKGGESKSFTCVPGTSYVITEAAAAGYTTKPASRTVKGTMPENPNTGKKFEFKITYVKPDEKKATSETFKLAGGDSKSFDAEPGSAYKVEETAPTGKWSCTTELVQEGNVGAADTTEKVTFKNKYTNDSVTEVFTNERDNGALTLIKASKDPDVTDGNHCYSLEGVKYAVYAQSAVKNEAGALAKGQPGGVGADASMSGYAVAGDERVGTFYVGADGTGSVINAAGSGVSGTAMALPTGTYYVVETAAGKNYILRDKVYTVNITKGTTVNIRAEDSAGLAPGRIIIRKESKNPDYPSIHSLEGVQFTVQYFDNTEGEASGDAKRTWILETKWNADEEVFDAQLHPDYLMDGSDALYYNAAGEIVLPVGTVSIEETKPAKGFTRTGAVLMNTETGEEIPMKNGKYIGIVTMNGSGATLSYGNLYTMLNTPVEVHTDAVYIGTEGHYVKASEYQTPASGEIRIRDRVTLHGLDQTLPMGDDPEAPVSWKLKGTLRDVADGRVIAAAETDAFTAESFDEMHQSLEFTIPDAAGLEGHVLYVAEELYYRMQQEADGQVQEAEELAACEDEAIFGDRMSEDEKESQRIHFPQLKTELTEPEGTHSTSAQQTITLTDTVRYAGLIPGHTYTVKGVLMTSGEDGATPLLDDNGAQIVQEETFTAEAFDGTVLLTFTFPAVTAAGKKVVAFEHLYEEEEELAGHADMEDEAQTVAVLPTEIGTTFTDAAENKHKTPVQQTILLTDRVAYKGAVAGVAYEMTGTVMDRKTGMPLTDPNGNPYQTTFAFTPETPDGTVELSFNIDARAVYGGRTLVAFEEMTYTNPETEEKTLIAVHKDFEDQGQTVRVTAPEIKTSLATSDGARKFTNQETLKLQDEVVLKNLMPKLVYQVRSYLVDRRNGRYVRKDGSTTKEKDEAYIVTKEFTAKEGEHTLEMPFRIDASKVDYDIVCFEELYLAVTDKTENRKPILVTAHTDRNNGHQTVTYHSPTGDRSRPLLWTMVLAAGLVCAIVTASSALRRGKR